MEKVIVCKKTDISNNKMFKASIDGKEILVVNLNGNFYAINDTCTHSGASLADGKLEDSSIICGWHGAKFDCTSGKLDKFPAKINDLKSYKVTLDSDNVLVEV